MQAGCSVPPAMLPRMIRMGQGRKPEMVFHPSLAYQRLLAENQRLAGELIDIHLSGVFIPKAEEVKRAIVARKAMQRDNMLKSMKSRYQTDPVYRAKQLAKAAEYRKLVREAKKSKQN